MEAETPVSTSETPTAQIPVSEPLAPEPASVPNSSEAKPEIKLEPKVEEVKPEPVSVTNSNEVKETKPKPILEIIPAVAIIPKSKSLARELLVKARNMIQFRKERS